MTGPLTGPLPRSDAGTVLIGGRWEHRDGTLAVTAPGDGGIAGEIDWADGGAEVEDARRAADAAAAAFDRWSRLPARDRGRLLLAAADLIDERADGLARLLAREAGKRLPEARGEIAFSGEYFRWFAEEARRAGGVVLPQEAPHRRHVVLRSPSGVVASLTPWNFPCSIQARKLAPALAAGCTVVARVSEKAPLAVTELVRCLTDAGLPPGVVNLVHGPARSTTAALLAHPAVRVVTFTGSTAVGREIMGLAARRIVRPLLELGGDAPFLVLDDADVDAAVEGAVLARFRNTGQSCIGANRFLVQPAVQDEFTEKFVRAVDAMTVGDGLADPCPDLGPVIDDERKRSVEAMVGEAVDAGAKVLTADRRLPAAGSFVVPTLLADVPRSAALAGCEIFGPVAGIFRVRDDDEAIRLANDTEMGLAAYVWSRDGSRCWRTAERLQAGIVGVNEALPSVAFAPMGGVKQSGLGREGADVGLHEFTDLKYASLAL